MCFAALQLDGTCTKNETETFFWLSEAQEAKAHDVAGDNPKDFDPFKDAERAAQKAAALAAATVKNLNLNDVSSKVTVKVLTYMQLPSCSFCV